MKFKTLDHAEHLIRLSYQMDISESAQRIFVSWLMSNPGHNPTASELAKRTNSHQANVTRNLAELVNSGCLAKGEKEKVGSALRNTYTLGPIFKFVKTA